MTSYREVGLQAVNVIRTTRNSKGYFWSPLDLLPSLAFREQVSQLLGSQL